MSKDVFVRDEGDISVIVEKMDFHDNAVMLKKEVTGRFREMFAAKQFLKTMHLVD